MFRKHSYLVQTKKGPTIMSQQSINNLKRQGKECKIIKKMGA